MRDEERVYRFRTIKEMSLYVRYFLNAIPNKILNLSLFRVTEINNSRGLSLFRFN